MPATERPADRNAAATAEQATAPAQPWRHSDVSAGVSPIAGSGLIASAPIAMGVPVVRYPVAPTSVSELIVNHSCDPSLWWDGDTLVARRDLAAGDELTCDYATASSAPNLAMYCHCDTYRCRQLIAGDDWQIPQLQHRYARHWAPHLQQLIDSQ